MTIVTSHYEINSAAQSINILLKTVLFRKAQHFYHLPEFIYKRQLHFASGLHSKISIIWIWIYSDEIIPFFKFSDTRTSVYFYAYHCSTFAPVNIRGCYS